MSRFEVHKVKCPDCGHAQSVDIYVSISADRMPGVTDQLINDTWERFSCDGCGRAFVVDNRLIYTDLPQKLWIVRYPQQACADFRALEKEAAQVFQIEYRERAPEQIRKQAAEVAPRICFGRPQLMEKLLAWRHGLDDSVLECLKLNLLRDQANQLLPLGPAALRLVAVQEESLTLDVVALADLRPLERIIVPRSAYSAVAHNIIEYRTAFPELFNRTFVDAIRYIL